MGQEQGRFLDKEGRLPKINKIMLVDAIEL